LRIRIRHTKKLQSHSLFCFSVFVGKNWREKWTIANFEKWKFCGSGSIFLPNPGPQPWHQKRSSGPKKRHFSVEMPEMSRLLWHTVDYRALYNVRLAFSILWLLNWSLAGWSFFAVVSFKVCFGKISPGKSWSLLHFITSPGVSDNHREDNNLMWSVECTEYRC